VKESADVAVAHLVRAGNDARTVERFVESYERFPAGARHALIFLLKGFGSNAPPSDILAVMNRVPHHKIDFPDEGYDIGTYLLAAKALNQHSLVFTNSFARFRTDDWLRKLLDAYHCPGVGLVGATGSWESMPATALRFGATEMHLGGRLAAFGAAPLLFSLFPGFPNPHVRTNGFLVGRDDFLALRTRPPRNKLDAWMFESGRHSMTRQIIASNRRVLLVGRDGSAYETINWNQSGTFWQAQQENLLLADNRTEAYAIGGPPIRQHLSRLAWGVSGKP